MTLLLVMLGAAVGAPTRYLTDLAVKARTSGVFPWGTLVVNVVGSFVLGVVMTASDDAHVQAALGTGFCGTLTTYSTFASENLTAIQEGRPAVAWTNVVVSVTAGALACVLGVSLAS